MGLGAPSYPSPRLGPEIEIAGPETNGSNFSLVQIDPNLYHESNDTKTRHLTKFRPSNSVP